MKRHVMLVTGSRVLDDSPRARAAGLFKLHAVIDSLPESSIVVSGRARGPDQWSKEVTMLRSASLDQITHVSYGQDQYRVADTFSRAVLRHTETRRWVESAPPPNGPFTWREWFLMRDKVMVDEIADAQDRGAVTVRVLAMIAPWSKTHGTAATAKFALNRGLDVELWRAKDSL